MDTTLYESIFRSSVEGIIVFDEKGKIIEANTASEQIFDYKEGELHEQKIEDLIPQKHRNIHKLHIINNVKQPLSRQSHKLNNLIGLKKDGTEFPIDISLSPTIVNDKGLTVAFLKDQKS